MDSQTKVMTVSYGTFSCTLEGFDDPFTTMQLVAEYFRKLATNDRYFGGDPLQPDANMLHQIARDANPNKVDAEVAENGVILRQADVIDAAPVPQATPSSSRDGLPVFTSKRTKHATPASGDESFVDAAVFSSRRNEFEPAQLEPVISAAELLHQDDLVEDTAEAPAPKAPVAKAPVAKAPVAKAPVEKAAKVNAPAEKEPIAKETVAKPKAKTPDMQKAVEKVAAAVTQEIAAAPEFKETPAAARASRFTEIHRDDDIQHEEEALERLLETTNSKLSTPSHARRSNALERLKAAVAATEAERRLRGGSKTSRPKVQDLSVDPDAFRQEMRTVRKVHEDDLKISRPTLNRKSESRRRGNLATLILGSEQQVVDDASEPTGLKKNSHDDHVTPKPEATRKSPNLELVRPVAQRKSDRSDGFAAFAEKSGANTLHQLLEASAAYLAIVEEQPRFSQERLIANIDGYLQQNNLPPEAASRSLNRLLRDGRILRVKADRFTISKSMRHGYMERLAS